MATYKVPAYTDFNTGSGTGNGSQQTIAHGLSGAPNRIRVWPTGDPSGVGIVINSSDATNIYVTVTNGKGYIWEAGIK